MSEHTDVDHPRAPSALASRCPCGDRNRNGWIATGPACLRASCRTDRRSAADWVSADIAVSTALRPSRRHHTGDLRATVSCSVAATLRLVAPVAMHRLLFRYHRPGIAVSAAHRLAYAGLVLLGVALLGVTVVVFEVVHGRTPATLAGGVVLVSFPAETRQTGPPRPTAPDNPTPQPARSPRVNDPRREPRQSMVTARIPCTSDVALLCGASRRVYQTIRRRIDRRF
jgi:hypothetical protein